MNDFRFTKYADDTTLRRFLLFLTGVAARSFLILISQGMTLTPYHLCPDICIERKMDMNYAFKGFFDSPNDAEAAYYALRQKSLVYDLETSNLVSQQFTDLAPQIAASLEANPLLGDPGASGTGTLTAGSLSNNDPRAAMIPFLENETPQQNSFYLYGHCRKKDLEAVSSCLKHYGAFTVLSSGVERPSRIRH